ncbi:hypothetical protein DV515_00006457 [Chloebia gouldiae]|uniref:Uncharacterized protein n=1 Tax=Chloebia gouldiae TaxID=44316 RepID=A0A3L8SKW7_CHLGU|nr:hypothetical protein DV515_00006457 [Chloebia gouldiae]
MKLPNLQEPEIPGRLESCKTFPALHNTSNDLVFPTHACQHNTTPFQHRLCSHSEITSVTLLSVELDNARMSIIQGVMLHCLLAEFQAVNERIQLDPALIWCKKRPGEAGTGTRRLQAPQP